MSVVGAFTAVVAFGPATTPSAAPSAAATATPRSDLPAVALADLPEPARSTLQIIDQGGPFPYRQDATVFANREGMLPAQAPGYYREYTVPTPGSPDRGARRLVVGAAGDIYYTADHYESFHQVLR
jgi:ribonuclease T1